MDRRVREGDALFLIAFGELGHLSARAPLKILEARVGEATIRRAREHEDHVSGLHRRVQEGRALTGQAVHGCATVEIAELVDLDRRIEGDALLDEPRLLRERAEAFELRADHRVVAFDRNDLRHVHTRMPALAFGHHAVLQGVFVGGVVEQRDRHDVELRAEMILREAGEHLRQGAVNLEVRSRLPRRLDRSVEGMDVGMHIRRGQVFLLIPGRGGKDDIGVQRGRGVAEVRDPHEVEFAFGRFISPLD